MSAAEIRIAAARGEADAARTRFVATVEQIKLRLAPKTIAQETWDTAKAKGTELADHTLEAVKERPAMIAGVATGAALLIARKPVWNLLAGLFRTPEPDDEPEPAPVVKSKTTRRPRKPRATKSKE